MAGTFVKNLDEFMAKLRGEVKEVKRQLTWTLHHTVVLLHEEITSKTPVNTGMTIRNYVWSMDESHIQTLDPDTNGSPYGTNEMPLGPEPRRSANLDLATATLGNLTFDENNPYRKYVLTNTSEAIEGLEYGILPEGDGFTPRSPEGMFQISLEYVFMLLEMGQI